MFGRKNGIFVVCLILLPAVTVSCRRGDSGDKPKRCKYELKLTTGSTVDAETDDNIKIQIRDDGPWLNLDNSGVDYFERGHTDTFKFEDNCVDRHQQTTIGSAGHAKFIFCYSNPWYLTYVSLMTLDDHPWMNSWSTNKWFFCKDKLKLPKK